MFDALLPTKLYLPPMRADWVARPRLLERLGRNPQTKLVLVSAPAGYGKTTLVTAWLRQLEGTAICWLSLDADDSDPQQFFRYLAAAIRPLPAVQTSLEQLLQANQEFPAKTLVKALVHDLSPVTVPFLLILDDYHVLDSAEVDGALAVLLDLMPPQMTLALTSRSDPGFPIARLRARGQLIELRADDLRFTAAEAAQFLQQTMGLTLQPAQIAALEARTEGWIAGLQMAALSLQHEAEDVRDAFVRNFAGSHRYIMDYLIEEVFNHQPQAVQDFLLQTAVLNRFNASLCDAVRQDDQSEQMLSYIEAHNLFLIPLDDHRYWYRYHHLFAEFFRMKLQRQDKLLRTLLHRRAADWFAGHNLLREAFHHAEQADDRERIAALIITHAAPLMQQGRFTELSKWLALLPTEIIQANSVLFMAQLWVETTLLGATSQEPPYAAAQIVVEQDATLSELIRRYLLAQLDAMRAMFAANRNQPDAARNFAERALLALPGEEVRVRQTVNLQLGSVLRFNGDFGDALAAYRQVLAGGVNTQHALAYFLALYQVLRLLRLSNRLNEAYTLFEKHVAQRQVSGEQSPLVGFEFVESAYLHLARGHLDKALALAQQALPLCEQTGFTEVVAYAHHLPACVYALQQQPALAQAAHNEVQAVLQPTARGGSGAIKMVMALRFARLQGDTAALDRLLADETAGETLPSDLQIELKIELAQAHLAQNQPTQALALMHELEQTFSDDFGFLAVDRSLVTGAAYLLIGEHEPALVALNDALNLAVPQQHLAPFILGGDPVRRLLQTAYNRLDDPAKRFVDAVFAVWGTAVSPPQPLVDPLSERELEILTLIAAGLKNKEIAGRLVISLNTVLYHNKNIYGKLGVRKRTQAVAKAQELGLI